MKKIVALLLALLMVFGFTACGNGGGEDEVTKVGFIYIGSANDGGFTQAHDDARKAMEAHFDGTVKTFFVEEVAEDKEAVKTAALNLMDQGCTVVIACSFGEPKADARAAEILAAAYGRRVVSVDARPMYDRGGGIHCITQQQPKASA